MKNTALNSYCFKLQISIKNSQDKLWTAPNSRRN